MPRLWSRAELKEEFSRRLGKPKNAVDKHIYDQLLGLAGKKVVIQYGMHLGENPGRFAAMLARKELGKRKGVGFLEFTGAFDVHRDALIGERASKLSKGSVEPIVCRDFAQILKEGHADAVPRDILKHLKRAERELIRENIIPSESFDRDAVEGFVFCVFRPDHYIDVHASPSEGDEPFIFLTRFKDHEKIVKAISPEVSIQKHEALECLHTPLHSVVEVSGPYETPEGSRLTPKRVADFYKLLKSVEYGSVERLDRKGTANARAASGFLVKFVDKLLKEGK